MTDDFTTAARVEAEWRDLDRGVVGVNNRAWFRAGARWARDHLAAQEPTDAEVEAAAEALWNRHSDPLERKVYQFSAAPSRMRFVVDARAALTAARRDEEKR